jgi:pantoate--beta-alanine ligase
MLKIIDTVAELRNALKTHSNIALVPTMGNLHDGHLQLVAMAKQQAACVVVSIFVNPLQFGANEDLACYPRSLAADCAKLKDAGADIVFIPSVLEMYPDFDGINLNQSMTITAPLFANELCGASRPGHFSGVATIVMKLFNSVMPQVAIFGKKDFQQLLVIRTLVKQFNLPITILAADTQRDADGLALSSRNSFLSPAHKIEAAQLQQHLQHIASRCQQGDVEFTALEQAATSSLNSRGWQVDYISVRSALTLAVAGAADQQLIVMAAARLGNTRLIDNVEFLR